MARRPADEHLPLTPRVFLILWALHRGPTHGYALLSRVEEVGRGRVTVGPASLYEALQSLHQRRLVREVPAPPDAPGDDRRRRYWQLTGDGEELLRAEATRLADLVRDVAASGLLEGSA